MGAMTIREALARSRNIPAVKALNEVGTDKAKEFVNGLGLNQEKIYESSALGGLITMLPPYKWLVPLVPSVIMVFIQNHML